MDSNNPAILAPVTSSEFFARYWEQQPLHIERSNRQYFSHLISVYQIEQLLADGGQTLADIQIADASRQVSTRDYTVADQRIDAAAVRKHYLEGSTVVLNGGQRKIASLAALCRSVTQQFCLRCQTNVYLSPASQQGFSPHFDTHDVFILQVSGSKTFRFYASEIDLPFTDDSFDPARLKAPELQHQITVNAGDTLYIPRGVVHDAVACGNEPSLHITLGVYALILRDLLQEVVQVAAESDVALRRSVPPGNSIGASELMALLASATDDQTCSVAASRLLDDIALGDMATTNNALVNGPLNLDSTCTVNTDNVISVESDEQHLKLRLHGQILEFDADFARAVRHVLQQQTLSVGEIAGLNSEQQLALCLQLQASGLLQPVQCAGES